MTTIHAGHPATMRMLNQADLRALHVHRAAGYFRVLEGDERQRLIDSITAHAYDPAHPLVVWSDTGEIVDGRNRRDIAAELECSEVPAVFVDFPDEAAVARGVHKFSRMHRSGPIARRANRCTPRSGKCVHIPPPL
jgi:ParB/Sulfiredoxin domain